MSPSQAGADAPVVYRYQQALDRFRREGREPPLLKRMSELISLLDLTTTLGSSLSRDEILDAALLIVLGELRVQRGALLVREEGERFTVRAARGLPSGTPAALALDGTPPARIVGRESGHLPDLFDALNLELICPVLRGPRVIALLGLGPREGRESYGDQEEAFLRSVAACAATPIENGLIHHELQRVNQKLSVKVFQLRNLFEISRELTTALDEDEIQNLVMNTLMGHLLVSRCALYLAEEHGLRLAHQRGVRTGEEASVSPRETDELLAGLVGPTAVEALAGTFGKRLRRQKMARVVPVPVTGDIKGLLVIGARLSGSGFTEEDDDFAVTLGRQALAALESVRLQQVRAEKQRQDRELQIAREIQRSLFPDACPHLEGFGVAAESRSCHQVGGDLFDYIPLGPQRAALVVADVSGKGTPASILMASVHASLRALAGTLDPAALLGRLNHFLFASTQANKFVTLFYGELDAGRRRLRYVTAGHVPPYLVGADGSTSRLEVGGPVLGLLDEVRYEVGEVSLDSGALVAVVTDGATEAMSTSGAEFEDRRVLEVLCAQRKESAETVLAGLLDAVSAWTGAAGCSDDLTALIVKAAP